MKTWMLAGLAALLLSSTAAAGDEPIVGQPAPKLTDVNWVKGSPVTEWKKGEIYVLDFWATWCPPCRKSIPHINELAKAHRGDKVNVIGVAVWPRPNMEPTDKFVADKGADMDYLIAEDIEGKTAKRFMDGSLSNGIPTVFVIDREGQMAWIGSPFEMDGPFKQILAGNQDKAAFAAADKTRRDSAARDEARSARLDKHMPTINAAAKAKDWPTALAAADALLAEDPSDLYAVQVKYKVMRDSGDAAGATRFAVAQVKDSAVADPMALNEWAWNIVDPAQKVELSERDLDLAMAAAARADDLTQHASASIIDTLARVHFLKGDVTKAIELQRKAIEVADAEQKPQLQPALDEYLKAAPQPKGS
jgi:thiol-disulfide isomerase/thioredoxin